MSKLNFTLTIPDDGAATCLARRDTLATVHQFTPADTLVDDLVSAILHTHQALLTLEANPPALPAVPEKNAKRETEPTFTIPLKRGSRTIPQRLLQFPDGTPDEETQRLAFGIVAKLIDGKLWDAKTPLTLPDVHATAEKMRYLTPRDLSMFTLDELIQSV